EVVIATRALRHRGDPALAPGPRLDAVQASVDQDAREAHLEGELLAEGREVRVRLDEGILHGLVGLRDVTQVMERNTGRAPLVTSHQLGVPLTRLGVPAVSLRRLDGGGRSSVSFAAGQSGCLGSCHGLRPDGGIVYHPRELVSPSWPLKCHA